MGEIYRGEDSSDEDEKEDSGSREFLLLVNQGEVRIVVPEDGRIFIRKPSGTVLYELIRVD